jgi:hypothetical protein
MAASSLIPYASDDDDDDPTSDKEESNPPTDKTDSAQRTAPTDTDDTSKLNKDDDGTVTLSDTARTDDDWDAAMADEEQTNQWLYSCIVCGDGGDVVMCDACPRVYHLECLNSPKIGRGSWCVTIRCHSCTILFVNGVGFVRIVK